MFSTPVRQRVAAGLVWLLAALLILNILRHLDRYLWDFKVYYHAAQAFSQGADPYQVGVLHRFARGTPQSSASTLLPFLYPPLTLHVFRVLTLLPILAAARLWFVLKLACLIGILALWDRFFVPLSRSPLAGVFLLLAFNRSLYTDLVSGNISLFEEALIWAGFWGLLHGRPFWGGLCIALAAQFKVVPILFLLLWLLVPPRPYWVPFLASASSFAALFSLNLVLHPVLFRQCVAVAGALDERGVQDPSSLAFLRDAQVFFTEHGLRTPDHSPIVVFLIIVSGVLLVSARAWRDARRRGRPYPLLLVLFSCLVYALCLPRFSPYTYVLLLVPALFALRHEARRAWVVVAALLVLAPGTIALLTYVPILRAVLPAYRALPDLLTDYLPLWSAFCLWGLLLRRLYVPIELGRVIV